MDAVDDALVRVAGAVAVEEFDRQMIERIEVWKAVTDRTRQQRIGFQQTILAHHFEHGGNRVVPFRAQTCKDGVAQR